MQILMKRTFWWKQTILKNAEPIMIVINQLSHAAIYNSKFIGRLDFFIYCIHKYLIWYYLEIFSIVTCFSGSKFEAQSWDVHAIFKLGLETPINFQRYSGFAGKAQIKKGKQHLFWKVWQYVYCWGEDEIFFSNFSFMFLNPNIFFQLEV